MSRLDYFLRPNSVAIIGASRKEGSLGRMYLDAIQRMNFTGHIYPVNPKADEINGIPCYPDIKALPEIPDLAVILLPAHLVTESFKDLAEAGIKNMIVISAGFRETGEEGLKRENQLMDLAIQYGIRFMGPNCMGVFNTEPSISFNGTFSPTVPLPGHIAFISQSGALGVGVLELSLERHVGFSVFASTGNKTDIDEADILEFLYHDQNTNVITLYLESVNNPNAFRRICRQIAAVKPILAIKAGQTESGFKAASSHTGAMANPEYILDGFFKQSGVMRFDTLKELFDSARALDLQPLPEGPATVIVTNAGGPSILASDAVEKSGLQMAQLSPETIRRLRTILPPEAATGNPIDMIASATHETYHDVMEIVLQDEHVDTVILIIVRPPVNTTPQRIIKNLDAVIHNCGKPVLAVLMSRNDAEAGLDDFRKLNIPVYSYPESAAKAMGSMWKYHQNQQSFRKSEAMVIHPSMKETLVSTEDSACRQLPLTALFELLQHYDIGVAPWTISGVVDDVLRFFRDQHFPIVLKSANEYIIHKSDAGLVHMGLDNEDEIRYAFSDIIDRAARLLPEGVSPAVLAQRQMPRGIELVLGGKKDPVFGPVIMVGIGGIFVEVLKDVSFRIAPVNAYQAREMLSELRSQALLDEFRGHAAIDRDSFAYTIQRFGLLLAEHPEIAEMDLNPLIWSSTEKKALVVDIRATLG